MNSVIKDLIRWFAGLPIETIALLKDIVLFICFVIPGAIYKMIYENMKTGKKLTLKWALAEMFITVFVAAIVWAVFDQFLDFNKFFTFAMCSLGGSFSTIFHPKIEDLIGSFFDVVKAKFKKMME